MNEIASTNRLTGSPIDGGALDAELKGAATEVDVPATGSDVTPAKTRCAPPPRLRA